MARGGNLMFFTNTLQHIYVWSGANVPTEVAQSTLNDDFIFK